MDWKELKNKIKPSNSSLSDHYQEFIDSNTNWGNILRGKLHSGDRRLVVQLLIKLSESHRKEVFDIIVWLACGGATDREVLICRKIILDIDREWVKKRIMNDVIRVIQFSNDDYKYYSSFDLLISMELFNEAKIITEMAIKHDDFDIQEAGKECNKHLLDPKSKVVRAFIQESHSLDLDSVSNL